MRPSRSTAGILLLAVVLTACGDDDDGGASSDRGPGASEESPTTGSTGDGGLTIEGFAFAPGALTVAVGDEVTVSNDDDTTHTWTADDGSFDSGRLGKGGTFTHTFDEAGTFDYHCEIHPSMVGTVRVS